MKLQINPFFNIIFGKEIKDSILLSEEGAIFHINCEAYLC